MDREHRTLWGTAEQGGFHGFQYSCSLKNGVGQVQQLVVQATTRQVTPESEQLLHFT